MSEQTLRAALLDQAEREGLTVCRKHRIATRESECPYCAYERTFIVDPQVGDDIVCDKHGAQQLAGEFSFSGYAGGKCYGYELTCGCTSLDESNDVAAAY